MDSAREAFERARDIACALWLVAAGQSYRQVARSSRAAARRQQVRRFLEPPEAYSNEPRAKEPMPADRRSDGAPRRCPPRRSPAASS
jgi:hypothetical protein